MSSPAITIVKFGGSLLEQEDRRREALDAFSRIVGPRVLVHGGGKAATALAARLGIPTRMVDGRRITDREMLDVVVMIYGGLVSKTLVAELQARGCNACGLSGADLDLIRAERRPVVDIDYGHVGDVRAVNATALRTLLAQDVVPVFAPLTHDGAGGLLNTNADTIAAALASALEPHGPVHLLYCFDHAGVMGEKDAVLPYITPAIARELTARGIIGTGMLPKLENAFDALRAGASRVAICGVEGLNAAASATEAFATEASATEATDESAWTEVRL
jgi:acetylglutamate kinase